MVTAFAEQLVLKWLTACQTYAYAYRYWKDSSPEEKSDYILIKGGNPTYLSTMQQWQVFGTLQNFESGTDYSLEFGTSFVGNRQDRPFKLLRFRRDAYPRIQTNCM